MSYLDRVGKAGPKKLLACDGGGIRGVITLEVLARIEQDLRKATGAGDEFRLADYFDYIGGTSTGAIIAAGLSLGMRVSEVQDLYLEHGREMFDRSWVLRRMRHRYDSDRLQAMLQRVFGLHTRFGSERLQTLLMMVLRNATTDSPWPLSNNPRAKYNETNRPDNNLELPLWQLVRASTAAPVYFPPESIQVGSKEFLFVDGGVTVFNNPAFQLFLMATLDAYQLGWTADEDEMLLVSVGTGTAPKADDHLRPGDMNLLFNASSVPAALMLAAQVQQDMLCRVLGRCRHGGHLDREIGSLVAEPGGPDRRQFSYVRYNAELTRAWLDERGLTEVQPDHVQRLDSVDHLDELVKVGRAVAEDVQIGRHFRGFL
jgi:hypothetical protein